MSPIERAAVLSVSACRAAAPPIPDEALDDRLATVGTSGSGKTYAMGTAVERLLERKARLIIPDPLGVWWGLRLMADGKTESGFPVVIFGGPHGDLPLTEHAGALIGEAAASMAESCILDLSELGTKASERRFMLAFLSALYRKATGEPVHVVFDEADMWAPQQLREKEGDAAKLLGMMETIVRRGRVKGFIPWLITQRPAVLSKDVLSQVDGVIAMKLVATQDRDALDGWIEGSADKADAKKIKGDMPGLQRGQGIVWLPGRGVLDTVTFPKKRTFDSSRTPKRGEVVREHKLKPLDVERLKERLSTVEAEIKANDPRALKTELAEVKRKLAAAEARAVAPSPNVQAAEAVRHEAFSAGYDEGFHDGAEAQREITLEQTRAALAKALEYIDGLPPTLAAQPSVRKKALPPPPPAPVIPRARPASPPATIKTNPNATELTRSHLKVIEALVFWRSLGFERPTRAQVAAASGYSQSSGGFNNLLGQLRTAGLIDYPVKGLLALTEAGVEAAPAPDFSRNTRERLADILSRPQALILDALPKDGSPMSREELGNATGYSPTSGGFNNLLGSLRSLAVVTYPSPGFVAVEPWVWS